ncbi:MAG: hypothetical protein IPP42_01535 [Saprospiraceae bacterium]|nr:hypothetical protein [Saprospiraceae bacterium]
MGTGIQEPARISLPYDERMLADDNYLKDCWAANTSGESFLIKFIHLNKK